jgi:hypothetical protein
MASSREPAGGIQEPSSSDSRIAALEYPEGCARCLPGSSTSLPTALRSFLAARGEVLTQVELDLLEALPHERSNVAHSDAAPMRSQGSREPTWMAPPALTSIVPVTIFWIGEGHAYPHVCFGCRCHRVRE